MSRTVAVALVLVGLFGQYGFSLLFGEPYPAIRYPAFQTVYGGDGWIDVPVQGAVVCLGRDRHSVDLEALFAPIPQSFIPKAIETLSIEAKIANDAMPVPTRVRVIDGNGLAASEERQLIDWLRSRVAKQFNASVDDAQLFVYEIHRRMPAAQPSGLATDRLTDVLLIDLRTDRSMAADDGCATEGVAS